MYTCFNYEKLNNIVSSKLINYKLNEDPEIDVCDVLIYSHKEISLKKFYSWHLKYLCSRKSTIVVFQLLQDKDDYKLFILPTKNKHKFANYLFSNDVIENSGLIELN